MSAPLQLGVYELWPTFEGEAVPHCVHEVIEIVHEAVCSPTPRNALNNGMRGLRRRQFMPLATLNAWLHDPTVVRRAENTGTKWVLEKWQKAIPRIIGGVAAHKAFEADKPGRPKKHAFTRTEMAAFFVLYSRYPGRSRAVLSFQDALVSHDAIFGGTIDEREVRRAVIKYQSLHFSDLRKLVKKTIRAKSGV